MPAVYTHLRFGEAVKNRLPERLQACIEAYGEAFRLGTQGPDVLFYHKPLKKNALKTYGMQVHLQTAEGPFVKVAKHLTRDGGAAFALRAYVMGFLCHFLLDTHFHPIIDDNCSDELSHGKIESELDKYMLRKDKLPTRGYNTATPISGENGTISAAATMLEVDEKAIEIGVKTMKKINGWFSSKSECFHSFAHLVLKIAGMDRKFGDMFLHKTDELSCASVNARLDDMWNATVDKAAMVVTEYFEKLEDTAASGKLENPVFQNNYTGR